MISRCASFFKRFSKTQIQRHLLFKGDELSCGFSSKKPLQPKLANDVRSESSNSTLNVKENA